MIKKLTLILSSLFCLAQAGIQGGRDIPDQITITNTTQKTIIIDKTPVLSSQEYTWRPDHESGKNFVLIRANGRTYRLVYPTYNKTQDIKEVFTSVSLDFATMACLTGEFKAIDGTQEFDEICLVNDTVYKIAAVVMLHKTRSLPRTVQPRETISRMVRDLGFKAEHKKMGRVILTDENHKVHSLAFPCRITEPADANTWSTVTLSANTIQWFNKGFSLKVN